MEQWILEHLPLTNAGTAVLLEEFANGGKIIIAPSDLAKLLGGLAVAPTHAALSAHPIAGAGWQPYFDNWKAQGFIT